MSDVGKPENAGGEQSPDASPAFTVDRALIYAILQGGVSAFQEARALGVIDDFLRFEDQKIFKICEEVFLPRGRMPTLDELRIHHGIDLPACNTTFDVTLCAQDVLKRALKNKLREGLGPIIDAIEADPYKARTQLSDLVHSTNWSNAGIVSRSDSPQTFERLERDYLDMESKDGSLRGYPSPWPSRDAQTLGLQDGEVTVVVAKKKTGKSFFLFKWAEHIWTAKKESGEAWLNAGDSIMIISMEMPVPQAERRFYAIHRRLDYGLFRAGRLPASEKASFCQWLHEMKTPDPDRPVVMIFDASRVRTVNDIVGLVGQYRPKVVFIDSFYILKSSNARAPKWEQVETVIADIKNDLAVGMNVPVVATSQLSAQSKRGDLNAESDAIAYSKAIGNWADAVDGLFGNDSFREGNKRILRGMEGRDFKTVDLEIAFDLKSMDFSELRVVTGQGPDGFGSDDDDDDDDDSPPDTGMNPDDFGGFLTLD